MGWNTHSRYLDLAGDRRRAFSTVLVGKSDRFFAGGSASVGFAVGAQINHSGVLLGTHQAPRAVTSLDDLSAPCRLPRRIGFPAMVVASRVPPASDAINAAKLRVWPVCRGHLGCRRVECVGAEAGAGEELWAGPFTELGEQVAGLDLRFRRCGTGGPPGCRDRRRAVLHRGEA